MKLKLFDSLYLSTGYMTYEYDKICFFSEIPAGFLRGSFYHYDRPKYLNYGAIGSIIGHEITHGFDSEGRKSDKNGNQIDWWQTSTKNKYLVKANCFVQQYNNYAIEETNLKVKPQLIFLILINQIILH